MPRETADAPRARQSHKARGPAPQVGADVALARVQSAAGVAAERIKNACRRLTKIGDPAPAASSRLVEYNGPHMPSGVI